MSKNRMSGVMSKEEYRELRATNDKAYAEYKTFIDERIALIQGTSSIYVNPYGSLPTPVFRALAAIAGWDDHRIVCHSILCEGKCILLTTGTLEPVFKEMYKCGMLTVKQP